MTAGAGATDHDLLVEAVTLLRPLVVQVDRHENRIGALERWRSWQTGVTAGAGAVIGAASGLGVHQLLGH